MPSLALCLFVKRSIGACSYGTASETHDLRRRAGEGRADRLWPHREPAAAAVRARLAKMSADMVAAAEKRVSEHADRADEALKAIIYNEPCTA